MVDWTLAFPAEAHDGLEHVLTPIFGKLTPVADHLGKRCRVDEPGLKRSAYPIMVLLAPSIELGRSDVLGMRYDGGDAIRCV